MDVRRYIISNPTMVKNADGIVEAYKPGEHVMVMAADYDAVSKERSAIMQSLECVIEKAEEFRNERNELRARLAEAEKVINAYYQISFKPDDVAEAYFDKYQEAK